jgi:uncharacterized membrane protein YcaP (DUF421 family)
MNFLKMPDWSGVFVPDASLFESFVRGSVVYLSILILFRLVMKRQTGGVGLPDLMLVVLVSECVSSTLSKETRSLANAVVAVGALLFWSYLLDRLARKWPWFQRLLEPQPVVLIEKGRPNRDNLFREGITDEELLAQLREHGIDDMSRVKTAILETEGSVSVIPQPEGETGMTRGKGRVFPTDCPDLESSVRKFLTAADELRDAIDRHERSAADHRAAAKMTRTLLARYGLRNPPEKPRDGRGRR